MKRSGPNVCHMNLELAGEILVTNILKDIYSQVGLLYYNGREIFIF